MLKPQYPLYLAGDALYLAGDALQPNEDLIVTNKYTGKAATRVALASQEIIVKAIESAVGAREAMRKLPSFKRSEVLHHCVERFQERREELAESLCIEAGKPIRDSRGEVTRLIDTFKIAAEEALRVEGVYLPLDISPRAKGYEAVYKRVPAGPCAFITPFNFPLNLAAHKVAPALAVGCPFILKPASMTPIGALLIGEILAETDLPKGAFSILPMARENAGLLVTDDRLKVLSFTGSQDVGWTLKSRAGKKRVMLELGGNAGCIVDQDADLDYAADRMTLGAFYQSGQSCISVQRIFIHEKVYDSFLQKIVPRAEVLKWGDPLHEETFLGPLITEGDAIRVEEWIQEALDHGAKILCGGKRHGSFIEATYLENVDPRDRISRLEVFAPVATIDRFTDFKDAVDRVNNSLYGLQAGVFTKNLDHAFYAWNELEVGSVVINDIPSMRVDNMPYGGVKDSGLGREGIRFSMEEMTELRLMVLNNPGNI